METNFETMNELYVWQENLKLDIYYMEEELELIKDTKDYKRMFYLTGNIEETKQLIDEANKIERGF